MRSKQFVWFPEIGLSEKKFVWRRRKLSLCKQSNIIVIDSLIVSIGSVQYTLYRSSGCMSRTADFSKLYTSIWNLFSSFSSPKSQVSQQPLLRLSTIGRHKVATPDDDHGISSVFDVSSSLSVVGVLSLLYYIPLISSHWSSGTVY